MTLTTSLLHLTGSKKLPIIHQSEAAECGLACLAMVVGFHGHAIDLTTLRRRFSMSLKGARLGDIIRIAEKLELSSRPVRLELDEMEKLRKPAILHWDLNHFVVLEKVTSKWIYIHNPATGARRYTHAEVSKHFSGIAIELTPTKKFIAHDERRRMRISDFWSTSKGLTRSFIYGGVFSIILQIIILLSPFYIQLTIDEAVLKQDKNLLLVLALGFGSLVFINVASKACRDYVILFLGNMLIFQLSINIFRHLIRLPLRFFENRHIGDIVSRFNSTEPIRRAFTEGIIAAIADGLLAITTLVVLCVYSWTLAGIVVLAVALYAALRFIFFIPLKSRNEEEIIEGAKQNSNFMESVRGIQSIKVFGKEAARQTLWENRYAAQINAAAKLAKLNITFQGVNTLLVGLENTLVVYLGATLVLEAEFSIGMLYAFLSYKGQFSEKMRALIEQGIEFFMLRLHLDRLGDIALAEIEKTNDFIPAHSQQLNGDIKLTNITFRYAEGEPDVFNGLSLHISAGEYVVITGASGCGKTTLIKIIMGLFEPTSGEILIDDEPINIIGLTNYRRQISAVMQEDQLMTGSLAENISFFDPEADFDQVQKCAISAGIHKEIMAMPMSYESLVGDMGTALSGGQKQRILIARALYHNPSILVLDEGTAHLDLQTEALIADKLKSLPITRIVIAHRPALVEAATHHFHLDSDGLKLTK